MNRRQFLRWTCAGTAGLLGFASAGSAHELDPPDAAWRRTYDELAVSAAVPAHGVGYVLVGRGRGRVESEDPVRVAAIDETGAVSQRREIDPDVPEGARDANADVVRTEDGYAVAMGSWFAALDADLSVETTGFAADSEPNSTTELIELADGFAVASELDRPNHVSTEVYGFDADGDRRWTRKYGEDESKWLEFLLPDPDGGLVVGGRSGDPWLASVAADGTERWRTTVADAPSGVGTDAIRDDDGFTLFGSSSMLRLDASGAVEWRQEFEAPDDVTDGKLFQTPDGDYVVAEQIALDRVLVAGVDAWGRPAWSERYAVAEGESAYLNDVVQHSSGEYLLVGSRRDAEQGWAMLLSGSDATTGAGDSDDGRSSTDGESTSERAMETAGESATEQNSGEDDSQASGSDTSVPGFGVGATVVGIGGALVGTAAGLVARRRGLLTRRRQ